MTIKIMYATAVQWNLVLCIVLMSTSCIRAQDVVRCHCNDASCVSTSYMCKSTLGTCYTRLTTDGVTSDARAVHGCIDQLPVRHQELCVPPTVAAVAAVAATTAATSQQQQQHDSIADGMSLQQRLQQSERSGEGASSSDGGADALKDHHQLMKDQLKLICCHEDMCNYMEGPDIINIYINTNDSQNKQHDRIEVPGNTQLHYPGPGSNDVTGSDGDLWFKAAVIAVPIAGGFILIMLVLLAVRLLRTDTQRHRHHLISMHNEQFYNQQYYQQQMYPNYPKYQMNYGGSGGGGGKAGHGFYEPQYRDDLQQDHQVVVAGPQHLSTVPTRQQTAVNQIYTGGNKGRNSNKNSDLLLAGHSQEQHHPLSRPLFVSVGPVGDGGAPGVHMRRDGGGSGGLVSSVGGGGGRCAPGGYKRISTDTSDSSASIVTWKEALPNNADDSRLSQADDKQRSQTDDKQRSQADDNQRSRPDDNRRSRPDDKQDAASVI